MRRIKKKKIEIETSAAVIKLSLKSFSSVR